jgi:agmatine deiminase
VVPDCATASACQPGDHDDQIYDAAAEQLTAAGLTVLRWPFQTKVRFRGIDLDTDYMNWLVANTIVVTISFGDVEADAAAKTQLEEWFPGREVVLLPILQSWYDGGGVHCHTNDQPKL